ncbi:hypothetical protein A6V29_09000 [Blastococcus sp. CCUG 61487]|nr:hypothetical protein A6V29_09000 [Blastococcus sp. CCUG 61487]
MPVLVACTAAATTPALDELGDASVALAGLVAAGVVWFAAGRTGRPAGWRMLAVAPLFPVLGAVLAALVDPADPVERVIVRWLPTLPGYLLAIAGLLCLVERRRLRTGRRVAAEIALFLTASIVSVRLLVSGSVRDWHALPLAEQFVLGCAVVVTSATMAAALVVLALAEPARRRMGVVLLVGAVLLTTGRGLGTTAILSGAEAFVAPSRFLVAGGLLLLAFAVTLDPGRTPSPAADAVSARVDVGQLLPMGALLVAVAAAGAVRFGGGHLDVITWVGLLLAVGLAMVHRWFTACQELHLSTRLRRKEAYFRSLVHSGVDAVVILDGDLRVTWTSAALDRVLGPAAAGLEGQILLDAVHAEDRDLLGEALAGPGTHGLVALRLQDADGVWRCMEAGIADLRGDADVHGVVLQCRDMTERQAREHALRSIAYTDPQTGLPNRAGMLQLLADRLACESPGEEGATFLLVELDGLLSAREHTGRDVVGAVVAETGRRLRDTVRAEDVVARMGGGAFAVLASGTGADVDRLAGRILSVVEQPLVTTAGIVDLTATVGLVELDPAHDVEEHLVRADLAVRAARAAGPGTAQRYGAALGEAAARRERLRDDLRTARARGELFLVYQPVVSLSEQRVAGVEAQLRWRHPELGDIPPAEFLPIAEQAGLIGDLQRFALEEAARAAVALPETPEPIRMGVDAPAGYVAAGSLVTDVEEALRRSGLAPERLVLEIGADTVTSAEDRAGLDIATLRLMGVLVTLTDFGGDTSTLTHLTRLPIDIVKLDRGLVSRIDRDHRSKALCKSMVGIGRALGMLVVAEGVDTPAQLAALGDFGCDLAQGFVLARPMPLEQLVALVRDQSGALWPGLTAAR